MGRPELRATSEWRERSLAVPLRWGSRRVRYLVALILLVGGGVALQLVSAYTVPVGVAGAAASVAGWIVVPAQGWRRMCAIGPGVAGVAAVLAGATAGALLAITIAAWLLVRERPLVSYAAAALPVAVALPLGRVFPEYGAGVAVAIVLGITVVAAAWCGRWLDSRSFARSTASAQRKSRVSPLK